MYIEIFFDDTSVHRTQSVSLAALWPFVLCCFVFCYCSHFSGFIRK